MLEKDCNGNPISTFPPCYEFQMNWPLGRFSLQVAMSVIGKKNFETVVWQKWFVITELQEPLTSFSGIPCDLDVTFTSCNLSTYPCCPWCCPWCDLNKYYPQITGYLELVFLQYMVKTILEWKSVVDIFNLDEYTFRMFSTCTVSIFRPLRLYLTVKAAKEEIGNDDRVCRAAPAFTQVW